MATLEQITASPKFQTLSSQDKALLFKNYFTQRIEPHEKYQSLAPEEQENLKVKYNQSAMKLAIEPTPLTWRETVAEMRKAYPFGLETAKRLIRGEERPFGEIPERLEEFTGAPLVEPFEKPVTADWEGMKRFGRRSLGIISIPIEPFYRAAGLRSIANVAVAIRKSIQDYGEDVLTLKNVGNWIKVGSAPYRKWKLSEDERQSYQDVFHGYIEGLTELTGIETPKIDRASEVAGGIGMMLGMPGMYNVIKSGQKVVKGARFQKAVTMRRAEEILYRKPKSYAEAVKVLAKEKRVILPTGKEIAIKKLPKFRVMEKGKFIKPEGKIISAPGAKMIDAKGRTIYEWDKTFKEYRRVITEVGKAPRVVEIKVEKKIPIKIGEKEIKITIPAKEKVTLARAREIAKQKPTIPVKPTEIKRVTVEELEKTRKKYGLEDISLDEQAKWKPIYERAEKTKEEALYIAKAIKKKARVLTNDEFAILDIREAEVEDLIDTSQADIAKAVDAGNVKEQERYTTIMDGALSELEEITEALRYSNRETGRALNIIKASLKKEGEQYKLAKILIKAKVAKGEKLTKAETHKLSELARKIEAYKKLETSLTKEIETLQEKLAKQDATSNFRRTTRTIIRKRTQVILKTERESLFKALDTLGYRVNEVIGVTYESAKIISKLAINYFESGVKDIDAIVEKIQTRIPDLSNKDVYDSIGGRIKRTRKLVVNETKRQIADLKTQARLLGEIDDAYNGVIAQLRKRRIPSAKVARLQRKLKELKRKAIQSVKDDEKLRKILIKIDTAQYRLKTGLRTIKQTRIIESQDIQSARQELSELRRLISTTDKITDLEKQLATGNFKVPVKIQRVIKNERLIETQVKLSQLRREVRERIHRMKKRTRRELFVDIVTLPRTLMATADFSGVLRQGAWLTARHPLKTAKIFVQSSKAFFSQNTADEIDNAIRKHEYQPIREKAGLFLASMDNIKFSQREEEFLSNLGERIPVWGRIVKASNRNMSSHLNLLRVASFDHFLKLYPNATDEELIAWASYINVASGRGYLGAFNKVADELSIAFFSPRFSSSRIELPFEIFRHWRHPNVRKEIAKNIMAFVSIIGTALYLAKLAGFEVELDPESSDFLKIKIGDTRIDLLAGLQQPMRVMLLAMLKVLDTAGMYKMKRDIDLYDAISRFVRYKFAPAISMPLELMQGKDAIGQETTILQTFTNNITPMVFQEIIDSYKSDIVLGSILAPFILLGVGVGTYKKKRKRFRL